MSIQRFHCPQLPDVTFVGIEGNTTNYFVHATQAFGVIFQKPSRKYATIAKKAFFESDKAKDITRGGDLCTAYLSGSLDSMIYSHRLHSGGRGGPSEFLSLEGIMTILDKIPNQDSSTKRKYKKLFEDCIQYIRTKPNSQREKSGDIASQSPDQHHIQSKRAKGTECGVYVLKFDDNAKPIFYVGKSNDVERRLQQHGNDQGASCTSGRTFTRVPTVVASGSKDDLEAWERAEVLERMYEFGIDAVRGWKYTLPSMPMEQKLSAFDDVCERFDLCRNCGRSTHFVRDCQALTTDRWTNGLAPRCYHQRSDNVSVAMLQAQVNQERDARLAAENRISQAILTLSGQ